MKVLVVGGGGREHALCWRLSQGPSVDRLFAAPGNAGIEEVAALVPIPADEVAGLAEFAERESIDLTVVGPEGPLVAGLADELQRRGLPVFGPTRAAARLEGSKVWAREVCHRHGIPAPRSGRFSEVGPAVAFLDELEAPYVIKADGLAGGKGVVIAPDGAAARAALDDCLVHRVFGEAGRHILVEEHLTGQEVSALALTDGRHVLPLALARDFKRALDGDLGPNTGGMGAFCPVPVDDRSSALIEAILQATLRAMETEGVRYQGVIYAGIMLTADGPKVLEFNCRFGDPETQVILPRLDSNLAELLLACAEGNLSHYKVHWIPEPCVGVVLASGGYPGPYETGKAIAGLDAAAAAQGVGLFHGGTVRRDDRVLTSGGRVLTVTALGTDVEDARRRAYDACSLITFDGMSLRGDIAQIGQGAA